MHKTVNPKRKGQSWFIGQDIEIASAWISQILLMNDVRESVGNFTLPTSSTLEDQLFRKVCG